MIFPILCEFIVFWLSVQKNLEDETSIIQMVGK
jgi:hypothetical protein